MAFRVRSHGSTLHVLPATPKGSEKRHILPGTLVKSEQLSLVIKRKISFRKHIHRSTNIKTAAAPHVLSIVVRFVP